MITVTLYTKDNCSLCDIVKKELESLSKLYPHQLVEVDITGDDDLYAQYRHSIPVVGIGQQSLMAPISRSALSDALQAASS